MPVDQSRVGGDAGDGNGPGVRHLADERSEQHDLLDVHLDEHLRHVPGECLPAKARLLAEHHDQVAVVGGCLDGEELGGRPAEPPRASLIDRHRGPAHLEVEELLRVDDCERFRHLGLLQQVFGDSAGRLARIVPAFERDDRARGAQCRLRETMDRIHARQANGVRGVFGGLRRRAAGRRCRG